jgi:hypothetical protein
VYHRNYRRPSKVVFEAKTAPCEGEQGGEKSVRGHVDAITNRDVVVTDGSTCKASLRMYERDFQKNVSIVPSVYMLPLEMRGWPMVENETTFGERMVRDREQACYAVEGEA